MRDAQEWLAEALETVKEQRWGSGNLPHGTLRLPRESLMVWGTVVIPFRHCLQGADLHTLKLHGLVAGGAMPAGWPLVRSGMDWSAQRDAQAGRPVDYNGNFGTVYRDFYLDGQGEADGLWFGGAQCSLVENVTIRHAGECALKVMSGSTRVRIADVDIENGDPVAGTRVGMGILLDRCRGVLVENVNLHCVESGLVVHDCASVTVLNATLEKVERVAIAGLGVTGIGWNWQWPGETPLDFRGNQGGTRLEVCFSKLPGTTLHYLDHRGIRRVLLDGLSAQFMRSRQVLVEVQTEWSTWWRSLKVTAQARTWKG